MANRKYLEYENNQPGAYASQYQSQIDSLLGQIVNRKAFDYNFNADPAYQQYRQRYTDQANRAMKDTVGQVSALTGGYGNSWAQTAGQQSYQQYMTALNDLIPELKNAALNEYNTESNRLSSNFSTLQSADAQEYQKHQDKTNLWAQNRNYYYQQAQDEQAQYNWQAEYNAAQAAAAQARAAAEQAQRNWQAEFNAGRADANRNYALSAASAAQALRGGDGNYGTVGGSTTTQSGAAKSALSYNTVKQQAQAVGVANPAMAKTYLEQMVDGGSIDGDQAIEIFASLGYKAVAQETGNSGLLTQAEFSRRKSRGGLTEYGTYTDYLIAMMSTKW
jgi:hypothetical protein